jgi:hypothetical protein
MVCDYIDKIVWQNSPLLREHHMKGLIAWHDGGMPFPRSRLQIENITYPEKVEIFKLVAASALMNYWKGNFSRSNIPGMTMSLIIMHPFMSKHVSVYHMYCSWNF